MPAPPAPDAPAPDAPAPDHEGEQYRLDELRVRNLGVIDDVTLTFEPGMTALTGETGAGKTLVIDALALLLGKRADPSMVRAGADEAIVEARFVASGTPQPAWSKPQPPDAAVEPDGSPETADIVLTRSIVTGGRSRSSINGRMASLAELASAGTSLLELHGQQLHRSLIHGPSQRQALDAYAGIDRRELDAARQAVERLATEAATLGGDAIQRAREVDLLRYQLDEIDRADIDDTGEDTQLEEEEDRLSAASAHRQAAAVALDLLVGSDRPSVIEQLSEVTGALAGRPPLAGLELRVKAAMAEASDLASELRTIVETWEDDPVRLDAIRSRRQLLHQLQRKYGSDLASVLDYATNLRRQIQALEDQETRAAQLDDQQAIARERLAGIERSVAAARRRAAPVLAGEIQATLSDLAMPAARVAVSVEGDGAADHVTFLLGANRGEPLLPLAKVASGGELARTMLALRLALVGSPGVLIFDEVDAGIGGEAATAVGAALAVLARRVQVLVVTHLAQVAAQADQQWVVAKSEEAGRTRSDVTCLTREERVVELSRMLSGSPDSASAQAHAREILDSQPGPLPGGPARSAPGERQP